MYSKQGHSSLIAKNTLFLYLRMCIVLVVSLITTRVLLHSLGVIDYGVFNAVCGFVALFAVFNSTLAGGFNRFFNYELGKVQGKIDKVYCSALYIQFFFSIVLFIVIEIIGLWYINNKMNIPIDRKLNAIYVFHFSTLSLIFTLLQAPYSAAVLAYERMDFYALLSILNVLFKLFGALYLQYSPIDGLLLYGIFLLIISFLDFLLYFVYCRRQFEQLRFNWNFDIRYIKSMLSFSIWSLLDPIAYTIRGQGCNLVLNYFVGPIANAAYGISNQVASGLDSFSYGVSVAFRPQIIQSYSSGNYERTQKMVFGMSKIMFVLNSLVFLPFLFEMDFVLRIWLGSGYPEYTLFFTSFILMVKLVNTFNPPLTIVMMASGNIKAYMISSFIIISSILPISFFLLKLNYHPVSMYIIMLVLTLINQTVSVIIAGKNITFIRVGFYIRRVLLPCFVFFTILSIILAIIHFEFRMSFLRFILSLLISIICSSIIAMKVVFDNEECQVVLSYLKVVTNGFKTFFK